MRSFSALPRKIGSPFLQFVVLLSLQIAAATMRWSEKMIRGHYVTQYRTGSRVEK
jgi:hypothetical protein